MTATEVLDFPRKAAHKADVQRVVNAKRIAAKRGNLIDSAFDIFGTNEPQSDSLFDEIPT